MNERIQELLSQCTDKVLTNPWPLIDTEKFAELIVEDIINIHKQEWYDWNNYPKSETDTPRDIGLRVGAKSQTIRLMHMVEKHFGIKK